MSKGSHFYAYLLCSVNQAPPSTSNIQNSKLPANLRCSPRLRPLLPDLNGWTRHHARCRQSSLPPACPPHQRTDQVTRNGEARFNRPRQPLRSSHYSLWPAVNLILILGDWVRGSSREARFLEAWLEAAALRLCGLGAENAPGSRLTRKELEGMQPGHFRFGPYVWALN